MEITWTTKTTLTTPDDIEAWPNELRMEVNQRIAFAQWTGLAPTEGEMPTQLDIWVTYMEVELSSEMKELLECGWLLWPGDEHGSFYTDDQGVVRRTQPARLCAVHVRWDGAETSTVYRNQYGQFDHWM